MKAKSKKLICLLYLGFCSLSADASSNGQIINIDQNRLIEVKISANSLNRISIKNDRIKRAFFDDHELDFEQDPDTGFIYVKPYDPNIEYISISLTSETGITQDLYLKVEQTKRPEPIILVYEDSHDSKEPKESHEKVVIDLIKDLEKSTDSQNHIPLEITINNKKIIADKVREVKHKGFIAAQLIILNPNKEELVLNEKDFTNSTTEAVLIKDRFLASGEKGEVIVVRRSYE